ncbi:Heat shock protein 70 [Oscillatoria nigro-viridis PCC 7112]|uniref:Heat shock protein 70 n=1 Tax=Phormidium nigroviride PCC 7112 TaxID=179408 RepID=K9VRE2_9CYAN|nr:Hsp70 family protein [Oscillatoria nigro-viridis]AFZ10119.1 Heat shock protein 70 [Oscillatoria nigro-viridis PCC 7112]
MSIVIGIDLGTTFSAMAYMKDGKSEIIPNSEGERITPSVVFFDDDNSIPVGTFAKNVAVSEGDRVVQFIKRRMGDDYALDRQGREWRPEDISALILKKLKQDAESYLNTPIRDAVITVPAYFDDRKRMATKTAGEIAGLNVLQIINEPTAAAMEFTASQEVQNKTILVYDLGGGTFDVTIMRVDGKKIDVIATGGDHQLGGKDIDDCTIAYFQEEFQKATRADPLKSLAGQQRLRNEAEEAKKRLSSNSTTRVALDVEGRQANFKITQAKFEDLIDELLVRAEMNVELVLDDANLTPQQIDEVLLVGGSSRIPAVSKRLTKIFGKEPLKTVNPDEVVAQGAAILAQSLAIESGQAVPTPNTVLPQFSDVCSHSLGVVSLNERGVPENSVIIPKNSTIPCKFSESYGTVRDNQPGVDIQILQGEDRDPEYCTQLGIARIENLPPSPSGSEVEITFAYDASGILSVTGIFVPTGQKVSTTIKVQGTMSPEETKRSQEEIKKRNIE